MRDTVSLASAVPAGACIARPRQTEGPYFVDEKLNRSDIRTDPSDGSTKPGVPLDLRFNVSRLTSKACEPISGAIVDVWHCDHLGVYSDVNDPGFNSKGHRFLRGFQVTDADGVAKFATVYPGWYSGRTIHIHFKIRTNPAGRSGSDFTSQLYFDDALSDKILSEAPYSARGSRTSRNSDDEIFRQNGDQLMLALAPAGQGYSGVFNIALEGV
ncbi:MAG: intradiol ring-cleavage dioxygenase [Gemmatimonadaceae bacterium]